MLQIRPLSLIRYSEAEQHRDAAEDRGSRCVGGDLRTNRPPRGLRSNLYRLQCSEEASNTRLRCSHKRLPIVQARFAYDGASRSRWACTRSRVHSLKAGKRHSCHPRTTWQCRNRVRFRRASSQLPDLLRSAMLAPAPTSSGGNWQCIATRESSFSKATRESCVLLKCLLRRRFQLSRQHQPRYRAQLAGQQTACTWRRPSPRLPQHRHRYKAANQKSPHALRTSSPSSNPAAAQQHT